MKIYVLYHGNCYDGFGAAFAAWLKFGADAKCIPVIYGHPLPAMLPGADVFILDFSYDTKTMTELAEKHTVVCLDHHATARTELSYLEGELKPPHLILFDMAKSGAVLAWEYFFPNTPVPLFFSYLQDRDLWKFELPNSREVSMALKSYPMTFESWCEISGIRDERLMDSQVDIIEDLAVEGVTCRRLTEQQVEMMAKNVRWAIFQKSGRVDFQDGHPRDGLGNDYSLYGAAPVANATVFFSEVGEKLLELNPEAKFSAYYMDRADGMRQWGLRSRPEFDCSKIAKIFGGGGHKQAAGFVQAL